LNNLLPAVAALTVPQGMIHRSCTSRNVFKPSQSVQIRVGAAVCKRTRV
jgi:hypothetical protein